VFRRESCVTRTPVIEERWPQTEVYLCDWHLRHALERLLAKIAGETADQLLPRTEAAFAGRHFEKRRGDPCESMIGCVRRTSRNVKHWSSGEMGLRWTAAGMLEAERQFRRVVGYRDLAKPAVAIEREVGATATAHEVKEAVTV